MEHVHIQVGPFEFLGVLETTHAPETVAVFRKLLPFRNKVVHVRWSGEAVWIPMGDRRFELSQENHTSHPYPGQVLLYPGGISEMEFLIPYGGVSFSSKVGQLAANHFMTLVSGHQQLSQMGPKVLWEGAQDIEFRIATAEE